MSSSLLKIWNRLSLRERTISLCCAAVVGLSLAWMGIVTPFGGFLDQLQSEVDARQVKLIRDQRWLAASRTSTAAADSLKASTSLGSTAEDMSTFLKDVEEIARGVNTRIVDVRPMPADKSGIQERLGISLEIESGLPSLAHFLYALQTSNRLYEVNRFQLSSGDGNAPLKMSLVLVETVFMQDAVSKHSSRGIE